MRPVRRALLLAALCSAAALSCKKKADDADSGRAVLTGYYSIVGLYSINANGTYKAVSRQPCQVNFLLYLKPGGQMELQRACGNVSGAWSYASGNLTVSAGSAIISGPVEFEPDGIIIDVNNSVDNVRYQLFRN
ncbi:MAG: hypothetical protein ABIN91_19090 [Mucilaginibacter sp.]|uniref:hypothetical protein n=1 Tax=Mucilaginibacter sp. TaxID=1882438 RepID=UPI003263F382